MLLKSSTDLIYRTDGTILEDQLANRLPEPVDAVPSSLTKGKLISVDGVVYVGNNSNVPVAVTYSHPTSSGNRHLPAGGTVGQSLINTGDGEGSWQDLPKAAVGSYGVTKLSEAVTSTAKDVAATSSAVKKAYDIGNHSHPYVAESKVGTANGVAPLDSNGLIGSQYLPSYVDDVLDGRVSDDLSSFTIDGEEAACTPETGKIYNDIVKNKSYRWSGQAFVCMNDGVVLGETETTAYRGDRGKVAYDHSQATHARTDATKTEGSSTNGNIKIDGVETAVYTHPTTAGYKHIPAGGSANKILKWSAAGTAAWVSPDTTPTSGSANTITSGAVYTALQSLHDEFYGSTQPTNQVEGDYWFEPVAAVNS